MKNVNVLHPPVLESGAPLYLQVRESILFSLSKGEWQAGEALPSERQLCERLGVSIGTLRKGIDSLVEDHILVRHQGRGTFVTTHSRSSHFFQFFNIAPIGGVKSYPEVRLIDFERGAADVECAEMLQLVRGTRIIRFRNLLSISGVPTMVDHISLPAERFAALTAEILRQRPSTLYNLYQDQFGHNIIQTAERVRALSLPQASADLLGAIKDTCALEIRRVAYTYQALPIEWRVSHLVTGRHEYVHSEV